MAYPYMVSYYHQKNRFVMRTVILIAISIVCIYAITKTNADMYKGIEIAITRIPVFILGCSLGRAVYDDKKVNRWIVIALCLISLIGCYLLIHFGVTKGMVRRLINVFGARPVIFLSVYIFALFEENNIFRKVLRFLGSISLELYMSHIMWINIYKKGKLITYYKESIGWYFVVIIVSGVYAYLALRISAYALKVVKGKVK